MISYILACQQVINSQFNAGLVEDGLIGVRTETAMRAAASLVMRGVSGLIQYEYGRASTYGGPDDAGDYYEGQAFFPPADPDGSGPKPAIYTPSRYYNEIVPVPLQAYLRPEMAQDQRWPVVRGKSVGVSYYLDPSTYYAAARVGGALAVRARGGSGLYLRIYNPAIIDGGEVRQVTVRVIDWGPTAIYTAALAKAVGDPSLVGKPWPFKIDLSPGAYAALGLRHGADRVWWEVL